VCAGCLEGSLGSAEESETGGGTGDSGDSGEDGGPISCEDEPCPEEQMCLGGLCVGEGSGANCEPTYTFADGCLANELCLPDPEGPEDAYRCYVMPYCPENGECPVGQLGALCNEQLVEGKDRICMLSLCTDAAEHCPMPGFSCIADPPGGLGQCSDGSFGMPCISNADCDSNNCWITIGPIGICF
jgi:hypothetical protein